MMNTSKPPYYGLIEALVVSTSVAETDLTGRLIFVNDKLCEMMQYREEELLGKHISMLGTKTQSSSFFLSILEVIFRGDIWSGEMCMATKLATFFWVDATIAPIKNANSHDANKYIVIFNNIRSYKKASAGNLKNFESQFESIEGRAELQKKLLEVEKLQTVGKLTSGIAHDFNNVLGCIVGYGNMCEDLLVKIPDEEVKDEFSENLVAVKRAADRATELIGKISQYLRIESQKEIRPIDSVLVIKEVVKMLKGVIPSTIKISTSFAEIPNITINTIDLHQMLTNLIVNARDAISGHGNIQIDAQMMVQPTQCSICMENVEREFVQICVTDDGSGIEKDKIQKIFDAFFTTKEVGKGTGLGLLAVSNIIHNVGGHVSVESELGKGTVFKLLFPIFNDNEYAQTVSAYLSANKEFSELNEKPHTVLVIDDDQDNANLIKKWLLSNGQKCEVFFKSQDALLYFISHQKDFDAIITDNLMPNLTGVELSKVVLGMCPNFPIIINSGTIDDIEKDDPLFNLENVHFLRKPINFSYVAKILLAIEV